MPKKILTIALFFGVAFAVTSLVSHSGAQVVEARQVHEWKYMTEKNIGFIGMDELNGYGSSGWELVQVCPVGENTFHYIFKKPKNAPGAK